MMYLLAFLFVLVSCGANNTTGITPAVQHEVSPQTITSFNRLKARIKLTSFKAGIVEVNEADLFTIDSDAVVALKQEQPGISESFGTNVALYFSDIDKRLDLLQIAQEASRMEMELILDSVSQEKIDGHWGWIGENGSQTNFESLPENSSRVVIKNTNKEFILSILNNQNIFNFWLKTKPIKYEAEKILWGKVMPLEMIQRIEVEHKVENFPAGLIKLQAHIHHFRVAHYEQAVRHEVYEELPGRGTVPRRVVHTCMVKMAKVETAHKEEVPLHDLYEFDQDKQIVSGNWWDSKGETTLRVKRSWRPNVVKVGLQNLGTCHASMRFLDGLPQAYNSDIASRLILSAEVYRAL